MKRLLLIGGGHSHAEVIRRFGLAPPHGVRITLVSPDRHTPYSGMLPGLIAGHYRFGQAHIDLQALCERAGIEYLPGNVASLDPAARRARLGDGRELDYDLASINTGSTPGIATIPGASAVGVPVKPVSAFLRAWKAMREEAAARPLRFAVVGGGAAGLEVVLAMHHALGATGPRHAFALVTESPEILPSHPARVRRLFDPILAARGIRVHAGQSVTDAARGSVTLANGQAVEADHVVWVTYASAPPWIAASGLATDGRGFAAVNRFLQSPSHPEVFAAGDSATMMEAPRPKSGVYAVRQGPVLARNLAAAISGKPLEPFEPQRGALALISAGDRYAVASWGPFAFGGAWVWRWKDHIDRGFMARYGVT